MSNDQNSGTALTRRDAAPKQRDAAPTWRDAAPRKAKVTLPDPQHGWGLKI